MSPVSLIIVGAGSRGSTYARFAEVFPDRAKVVGVAEPRAPYRRNLVAKHDIPDERVYRDWHEVAAQPRFADAVVVATQDHMHVDPAIAFANLGYDILLEKPMAPDPDGCRQIVDAVKRNNVILGVCHVLRYTSFTRRLKQIVDAGTIGDLVGIQRLEPVGFWHMAHSFVRGNWRNEAESGPMLLTKACHDLDWIAYMMGDTPCEAVSSFGTLTHFRREEAPLGAADRCLNCPVEGGCPYSAKRIYLEALRRGNTGWPVDVLTPEPSEASVLEALRSGPYGRCVYACDNDVVDHQVTSMQFSGGRTATFTMMAFTAMSHRKTVLFGTKGQLTGDGRYIQHYDFLTDATATIDTEADSSVLAGHGGGDYGVMDAFVEAVATQDASHILSGPEATLASHLLVFRAEQARREKRVVAL